MAGYTTPAWSNLNPPAMNAANLTALGHSAELGEHPYGVCNTAAGTAAKTVSIDFSGTLSLFTGLTVRVKFTNSNSASSPTLNVNGTGAKAILYGTGIDANNAWIPGAVAQLTYDGTSWVIDRFPLYITTSTRTTLNGVLAGDGSAVTVKAVDSAPAASSANLVTSGGVMAALDQKAPLASPTLTGTPKAPTAAAGTSTTQIATTAFVADGLQRRVNPNLLDNWYFPNAVNQRGKTTGFSVNSFAIDRWKLTSGTLSVTSSGLVLNGTITQVLDNAVGLTVTASALTSAGALLTPSYNDTTKTFTLTATGQTIVAAKLEIGSTQTLAHQEGSTYALNAIPNYAEELSKCQRYYVSTSYIYAVPIGVGVLGAYGYGTVAVALPEAMRGTISSVSFSGHVASVGGVALNTASIAGSYITGNTLYLTYAATSGSAWAPFTLTTDEANGVTLTVETTV